MVSLMRAMSCAVAMMVRLVWSTTILPAEVGDDDDDDDVGGGEGSR